MTRYIRVAGIEAYCFVDEGDCSIRVAQVHQRDAEVAICICEISVERDRGFKFDPGFG
jgi:hypothetical protein